MSKTLASRLLKEAHRRGETVMRLDDDAPVLYRPRVKFDPEPWFEPVGGTHHSGLECYADIPSAPER